MSISKEEIIENIKEWVATDNHMQLIQKKLKEYREKKKKLSEQLLVIMKKNEIDCFDIKDGKLLYVQNKIKSTLNKKTLLQSLEKYFQDNPDVNCQEISEYILENREIKINESIKRK